MIDPLNSTPAYLKIRNFTIRQDMQCVSVDFCVMVMYPHQVTTDYAVLRIL